jgi:hypothetical protein
MDVGKGPVAEIKSAFAGIGSSILLLYGLSTVDPAHAQARVLTQVRCDLGGTYDVMKSGSARVLGSATIECDRMSGLCIATDGTLEAQLEPRPHNIHRWLVIRRKGGGSWPRRFIATEGRDCVQILFANGTLWRRR